MFDLLADIFRINTFTACVVLALTGWAALLINAATSSSMLAVSFVPAMGFGALCMIYALFRNGIVFTPYADANVVISATVGMFVGFAFMIAFIRVFAWCTDVKTPVTKEDGSLPTSTV